VVTRGLGELPLARVEVDRAAHHRGDEAFLARAWADPTTAVLGVDGARLAVAGDALDWRSPPQMDPSTPRYLLGVDAGGRAYFAVHTALGEAGRSLREVGDRLSGADAGLGVLATALDQWHERHPHCPRCGAATEVAMAGFVRRCPRDGSEHHPRTDPAIIVLVTDPSGRRALLGRQASWPPRRFSTLAGFVEAGESAEAAVVREVAEESAVVVASVTYLASQAWPFPASLMLAFRAVAAGDADPVPDGEEIAQARWVSRDQLAAEVASGELLLPPSVSIARALIDGWAAQ